MVNKLQKYINKVEDANYIANKFKINAVLRVQIEYLNE